MRVCVFGAGAIGGHIAARLALAGETVSVVARGAHGEAIRRDGLTLRDASGEINLRMPASADPAELGPQDAVIVTVKGPALGEVAERIGPLLGPETPVVFAMNGVFWFYEHGLVEPVRGFPRERLDPGGRLARSIGPERSLGCVVITAAEVDAPGVVRVTSSGPGTLILGEPDGSRSARSTALVEALARAGFAARLTDDIRSEMWSKLAFLAGMAPVAALTGATARAVLANPELHELVRRIVEEVLAVARAAGSRPALDLAARLDPSKAPDHKPSLLQDLERGRPMEIDHTVAAVEDLARALAVPTPVLDIVASLLEERARRAGTHGDPAAMPG
jgi:2-dehydropantoate 2-reductase